MFKPNDLLNKPGGGQYATLDEAAVAGNWPTRAQLAGKVLLEVIPGTVEEWRGWTGLPFDRTGPVVVPGALAPVMCDAEHGTATYVEPNVWVRHPTGA